MNRLKRRDRQGQNEEVDKFEQDDLNDSFFWKSQANFARRQSINSNVDKAALNYQQNQDAETSTDSIPKKVLWKAILVWFLSAVSAIMGILASILSTFDAAILIATSAALTVAGTVAYKEYLLVKQPTLRSEINLMREQRTDLKEGIDELQIYINELVEEKERLNPIAVAMSKIAFDQGINVDEMVDLVKKSEIQAVNLKDILLKISIEEIIKIMLQSDGNNNFKIDNHKELQVVSMRAEIKLSSMGIIFNKELFEEEIRKHSDLATVIKNLRACILENEDNNRRILACENETITEISKRL
jgi:hypothetical protein